MKKIKLLSAFLTVAMVFGMLTAAIPVYAAEGDVVDAVEDETPALVPSLDEETGLPTINYLTQVFNSPEEKVATMTKYLEKGNYAFYVEPVSGEVAYVNTKTGQILLSNPYDVSQTDASANVKAELLSQVAIKYNNFQAEQTFQSFTEACQRGQINVKKIKNGVRVEYTLGRAETRKLVPRLIKKERWEELILANIPDGSEKTRIEAFYTLKDPSDPKLTERMLREMKIAFPITNDMAVYTIASDTVDRELNLIESAIKTYCPEYTYETLEEDHGITNYQAEDKAPPLFRLSLEYTLDEDGSLDVRLPANGIRFDESAFQLTHVSLLPWFGAGSSEYEGYTFIPDGSGALIRFSDISKPLTLTGKIYGTDFAYQQVSGQNREIMRLPVYGVVETNVLRNPDAAATPDETANPKLSVGFLAIIEEGDALASINSQHGGTQHKYNAVGTSFVPRPKDSYNLADAISVGSNATHTVVSERKYTGSYRLKFIMLTDDELAKETGLKDSYDTTYVGMANAYRDYLLSEGTLTKIENPQSNIPLYIESFGAIETIERILSIPVEVLKPLTTFDDLKEMYNRLSENGINNINFKLTGFANGGLYSYAPYHAEFEKAVGGDKGFTEFVSFANSNNIGVYPDFDFANISNFKLFDGVSMREHLVKTMDDRYTTKREYDSTLQSFVRGFSLAVSPSVFDYFFENFDKEYSKLSPNGISVATLGTDLNSDFDEDEPYNREDSKEFTTDLLGKLSEKYTNVMVDGGNLYSLPYADHILGVAVDSSRFKDAAEAVPFVGMVLHGSVSFTGNAINMAGDTQFELLKAIENGSSLYFTLSMQNTALLKESYQYSKYYSVAYDIWYDDVVRLYNELNGVLSGLQNKFIIDHEFLIGERVPSAEEIEADKIALEEATAAEEAAKKLAEEKAELAEKLAERLAALRGEEYIPAEKPVEEEIVTEEDTGYKYTKYTSDDGRIVKVTYEGGTAFILNYNNFDITVVDDGKTYTIGALNYVKVK